MERPPYSNRDIQALCAALCTEDWPDTYMPPDENFPSSTVAYYEISDIVRESQLLEHEQIKLSLPLYRSIAHYTMGRSIFRTSRGHIGLAPKAIRQGDIVSVLLGAHNRMILRPVESTSPATFQVVVEAYCGGILSGEQVLEALPEDSKVVWKWNEQAGRTCAGFLNAETGHWQPDDPRLSHIPLPPGWRREVQEFQECFYSKVEDSRTVFDPRLVPELLKERGVDIRTFDLV